MTQDSRNTVAQSTEILESFFRQFAGFVVAARQFVHWQSGLPDG